MKIFRIVCTRNLLEVAGGGLPKQQFVKRIVRLYEQDANEIWAPFKVVDSLYAQNRHGF